MIPITHIHGTIDIVLFDNVKYIKEHFENIKIVNIQNAGHEVSYRRSELVLPLFVELIEILES